MGNTPYIAEKEKALQLREQNFDSQMSSLRQGFSSLGIDDVKALKIASLNVTEAVERLNKGELTSQELLAALIYRCARIGKDLNIWIATDFVRAMDTAKECDRKRKETGLRNWVFGDEDYDSRKYLPPLFGIPISVKDAFDIDSMPTTLGIACRALNHYPESTLISCFRFSGMIPYIKTNVPQMLMGIQTNNHIWGCTLSPWNRERAVGGSSGGEGAIVSARCALLGIGTDVGGSIRIPAALCGVFGLKCCSRRIPAEYQSYFSKAFIGFAKNIPYCIGPLGKSARDLASFMDVATKEEFYCGKEDPYTKIVPFDQKRFLSYEKGEKKLRVGYIKSLKAMEPSLASRRAMDQVIQLLKRQGHELVEIQLQKQQELIIQFLSQASSCKMKNFRELLKGQKPIKENRKFLFLGEMWSPVWFLASKISKYFVPRSQKYLFPLKIFKNMMEYQNHIGQIQYLKQNWIDYWRQKKLDLVICPGFGCQAMQHGKSQLISLAACYNLVWNVVDMTVGAMPITVVKQGEQKYESQYNDIITRELNYIACGSKGLPVGIQVVALPYKEEEVLGFMSYLDGKVEFYKKYPLPL